jgi:hypothetical protein
MKKANTDKVEAQSRRQAKQNNDHVVDENTKPEGYSIFSEEMKGYPAPGEKDIQYGNQEEFIGSQPNKKKQG